MLSSTARERLDRVGAKLFERGWLSSNNILITGSGGASALIDSGYCTHADQTVDLVERGLAGRPLGLLLNTHLHSDHCGGNAALQRRHPGLQTLIPSGSAEAVRLWDTEALTYASTGQECPRFAFDGVLRPGESLRLGDWTWDVHGAKGHDPHAIVLFQPDNRVLLSADALWQNGFGVVFPELEGLSAFEEVGQTLDCIETLSPSVIVPGHGGAFDDLQLAMEKARSRLRRFMDFPEQHLRHAYKVLIKFKLLECKSIDYLHLFQWVQQTPYLAKAASSETDTAEQWLEELLRDLERTQAIKREDDMI
uniref:MBL fold metallo-hydrolase n=1 Tax=Hydrogenophaga flava TaxID=65657 RepID=UPI000A02511E